MLMPSSGLKRSEDTVPFLTVSLSHEARAGWRSSTLLSILQPCVRACVSVCVLAAGPGACYVTVLGADVRQLVLRGQRYTCTKTGLTQKQQQRMDIGRAEAVSLTVIIT